MLVIRVCLAILTPRDVDLHVQRIQTVANVAQYLDVDLNVYTTPIVSQLGTFVEKRNVLKTRVTPILAGLELIVPLMLLMDSLANVLLEQLEMAEYYVPRRVIY